MPHCTPSGYATVTRFSLLEYDIIYRLSLTANRSSDVSGCRHESSASSTNVICFLSFSSILQQELILSQFRYIATVYTRVKVEKF